MLQKDKQQTQVEKALAGFALPDGVRIRAWIDTDFAAVQLKVFVKAMAHL